MSEHDYIGSSEFVHLAAVLEARDKKLKLKLRGTNKGAARGSLTIAADVIAPLRQFRVVDFCVGVEVPLGQKYFFQVSKQMVCGAFFPACRSNSLERPTSTTVVEFKPFEIQASKLCGGSMDRLLRIELFRARTLGKPSLAGCVTFSLEKIDNRSCGDDLEWQPSGKCEDYKVSLIKSTFEGGQRVVLKVMLRLATASKLGL